MFDPTVQAALDLIAATARDSITLHNQPRVNSSKHIVILRPYSGVEIFPA